jgi:hypothetical protein
MATPEQVADVRRMADEPTTDPWTDEAISALVDELGTTTAAAARIWQTKAGQYAKLVNTSESGSSRAMGDLYKNALAMAKYYEGQGKPDPAAETTYPFTAEITRA